MKRKINVFTFFVVVILIILAFQNKAEANSYSIDNMDIQATIQSDGSVKIEQELTYKFNGHYNGIYITVPYNFTDIENEEIIKNDRIDDDIYNGESVLVEKVVLENSETSFSLGAEYSTQNGDNGVYTETNTDGIKKIKIYSPSTDEEKTFKIYYTINNLCVKHNDIGELYYNFIGGAWDETIKKLNIDIYLPNNNSDIKIWGHGPYNGESKIINNRHANFNVKNVKPGQYVAARILFDNQNIINSTKESKIDAIGIVLADEKAILDNKEGKDKFTEYILLFALILLIYWIVLLLIFEKDKKYIPMIIEEDELFKKYNPMIAGCIQGSRNVLARDIIAVALNLIDKGIIKIEIKPRIVSAKENYTYLISKNFELEDQMDEIEAFIYEWIFNGKPGAYLEERLKEMPKEKDANDKFQELNKLAEKNLSSLKANETKVPTIIRVFNTILFIICLFLTGKHILYNGFNVYNPSSQIGFITAILMAIIMFFPIIMGLMIIPLNLIIIIRRAINKSVQKVTGQKVVTTTISLLVFFGIIIALTYFFISAKYIVADEILICISTIILLTDNLMLKNNPSMLEDYNRLNFLKDKIKNYSIMEDRDIEQVVLWGKYLAYAVSFGIADKLLSRIKGLNLDDDLLNMAYEMEKFIISDYYYFYRYGGLDAVFLKSYTDVSMSMLESFGNSGGGDFSGGGGGFSGGGGYSGGGRKWRRRWSLLNKIYKYFT